MISVIYLFIIVLQYYGYVCLSYTAIRGRPPPDWLAESLPRSLPLAQRPTSSALAAGICAPLPLGNGEASDVDVANMKDMKAMNSMNNVFRIVEHSCYDICIYIYIYMAARRLSKKMYKNKKVAKHPPKNKI